MVFRIVLFWLEWFCVKMAHLSLAVVGFPLLPFAYVMKYHFGVKNVWLLNDTKDGDFGDKNWQEKQRQVKNRKIYKVKFIKDFVIWLKSNKVSLFIKWYLRNSVWNFKLLTRPLPMAENTIVKIYSHDVGISVLTWVNQSMRGMNHVYYEVGGVLYGRFSFSNNWINIQLGTTGKRYNFKLRLI